MKPEARILIVDDDRSLVLVAQRVLEKAGFDVLTAFDGWEGLQKAGEEKPDLIILDIAMPAINGYEVCRHLHRYPHTTRIPVIFLSAKGVLDERRGDPSRGLKEVIKAFDSGGFDFLNKPVTASVLVDRVKAALWLLRNEAGSTKNWGDIRKQTIIESQSKGERILVADDAEAIRDMVCGKLSEQRYEYAVAADGHSVLDNLRERPFDLVLLNMEMPGQLGTDVLREIVAYYPDTAVIVVTAIADVKTAIELMQMGAWDYITKPIDLSLLTVRVRSALDKRRLLLENRGYQLHLEEKVKEQAERIRQSLLDFVTSLASTMEAKDKYTSGHSQRVAEAAVAIAQQLGMTPDQVEKIRLAGLVHDIGKIGTKEPVLNKEAELTDEEYSQIVAHSVIGDRILTPAIEDQEILRIVRHHHERYDGKGYPDGLSAQEIPLGARILEVADAYDAMTSGRPNRKAVSPQVALEELKEQAYTQLDPVVVYVFSKILKGNE